MTKQGWRGKYRHMRRSKRKADLAIALVVEQRDLVRREVNALRWTLFDLAEAIVTGDGIDPAVKAAYEHLDDFDTPPDPNDRRMNDAASLRVGRQGEDAT